MTRMTTVTIPVWRRPHLTLHSDLMEIVVEHLKVPPLTVTRLGK
jgi:hypothetical protein